MYEIYLLITSSPKENTSIIIQKKFPKENIHGEIFSAYLTESKKVCT